MDQSTDEIRSGILSKLEALLGRHISKSGKAVYHFKGANINIRSKAVPSGQPDYRYRFDVTSRYLNSIDHFIYGCGHSDNAYVFPREVMVELSKGCTLAGSKGEPNFNINLRDDLFENTGTSSQSNIRKYFNAYGLLKRNSVTPPESQTISYHTIIQEPILTYPGEDETPLLEGAVREVRHNVFERNKKARELCIQHYGSQCSVCTFDFGEVYPGIGEGFIHVHHLKELSEITEEYEVDPIEDLRPVCPNCHAMIHKRRPAYSIEDIKAVLKSS